MSQTEICTDFEEGGEVELRIADIAVLHVHVENLQERAEAMEAMIANLATKDDVKTLSESVQGLVTLMNHGTGIYKFVIGLGAFVAALAAIIFGIHQLINRS